MDNAQLLYDIINDFIDQNPIPVIELLGIFEIIKIEQVENIQKDEDFEN